MLLEHRLHPGVLAGALVNHVLARGPGARFKPVIHARVGNLRPETQGLERFALVRVEQKSVAGHRRTLTGADASDSFASFHMPPQGSANQQPSFTR